MERAGRPSRPTGPTCRPTRARAPRGATPHHSTAPRRRTATPLLAAALLLAVTSATAGCDDTNARPPSPSHSTSDSPSPLATSPTEICVQLVTYWSRKALAGDDYGDYQKMGMSNGQYNILLEAVADARPVQRRQGTDAAHDVIDRQVREGCAERYRGGGPTESPWR
ncbi:hypothetical protein N4P33_11715 [Streptomyces sp. 15-116A]|uniref:hypothetical protein n=1 Tax=Streptomyces sp. 15-116A TaxID=2259035 RepID=UPI0021B475C9|nr:hypothetical protein [Streptomyces sp. 15-116A]MCT7352832.1 hypothetical protein [Streptomyces sp. 15-116A]